MCAARAEALLGQLQAEAKERQREGQERGRQKQKGMVENLPHPIQDAGKTRDNLGRLFGVSGKSVEHARNAQKKRPVCAEQPGLSNALHQVGNITQQPDASALPVIHSVLQHLRLPSFSRCRGLGAVAGVVGVE
jgi:hypothetical protein